jgi:hypothetical protein
MLQKLAEHGHRLSPGTLYPILARMTDAGLVGGYKTRRQCVVGISCWITVLVIDQPVKVAASSHVRIAAA